MHRDFVAKYRRRVFDARAINVLRGVFAEVCSNPKVTLVEMDGDDDPMRLLVEYRPKLAISSLVNSLKVVPVTCCANGARSGATFLTGVEASYVFVKPLGLGHVDSIKLSANVTNLTGIPGWSTAVVTSNSGGYQAYPIAPRMAFVTSSAKLD